MAKGRYISAKATPELLEILEKETKKRGLTNIELLTEALELYLLTGSRTKHLMAKAHRAEAKIEQLLKERSEWIEQIEQSDKQVETIQTYNADLAEQRDAAFRQRDKFKEHLGQAAEKNERLIAEVRDAQDGGIISRGMKVRRINLLSFQLNKEEGGDEEATE